MIRKIMRSEWQKCFLGVKKEKKKKKKKEGRRKKEEGRRRSGTRRIEEISHRAAQAGYKYVDRSKVSRNLRWTSGVVIRVEV